MAVGSPVRTTPWGTWLTGLQEDPDLKKLSPSSQAVLGRYAQQLREGTDQRTAIMDMRKAMLTDPELAKAMQEAQQVGAFNRPMSTFGKVMIGVIAAAATAGIAAPYVAGAGAAGASGAGAAGAAAGTGAATTAGVAGGMTLGSLAPTLIGVGANAAGQWYAQRQADKAAGRQVDQSREALALEKEMFDQEQAHQRETEAEDKRRWDLGQGDKDRDYDDAAGYRSIGLGALDRLAFGTGIPGKPSEASASATSARAATRAAQPQAATPVQPWNPSTMGPVPAMTGGTLGTLGTPASANVSQGGMTSIKTPTGQVVLVPQARVQEALANGGTVLAGAA